MDQLTFPSLEFSAERRALTVNEIAARLGVSWQHVINLIECGRLRAINIGSGTTLHYYRIPVESYREFLASSRL